MWVRSAVNIMTERSGRPDPAENLQRTLAEHSQQIRSHDSILWEILEQQRQANQQVKQLATLLQQAYYPPTSSPESSTPVGSTAAYPAPQQHQHFRKVTSPNPERYSGEVGGCRGFLFQCSLVFNRSPHFSYRFLTFWVY
ncbi:hypothetical protein ILYODFUR_028757 [Ilyodon furcidens]|uniref:Uncharacterized protein n=1 Tax=Ilyodon furcidens TaxID=33524 RepID=A0ABV0UKB0_9TELE